MLEDLWGNKLAILDQNNNSKKFQNKQTQKKLLNSVDPKMQEFFNQVIYKNDL